MLMSQEGFPLGMRHVRGFRYSRSSVQMCNTDVCAATIMKEFDYSDGAVPVIANFRVSAVGAVCDRAYLFDSGKNARSQTAPTAADLKVRRQ